MEKYLNILREQKLFNSLKDEEILSALNCMKSRVNYYNKNSIVIDENLFNCNIGIVLDGELENVKHDINGNKTIIAKFCKGDLFAEALVCAEVSNPPVTIVAAVDSEILFLDFNKTLSACGAQCIFNSTLIRNMLKIMADKNLYYNQKLEHITKRTIRDKLLSFLNTYAKQCTQKSFTIPYNRQALADFLCVDRSAMSAELSKLRHDGIIEYNKNYFVLK